MQDDRYQPIDLKWRKPFFFLFLRIKERWIVTYYTVNQNILWCNDCHEWLHNSKETTCSFIFKLDICKIQSIDMYNMFKCVLLKVSLLNIQIFKTFREIGTCQYIYACSINKFIFINYISTTCRDASSNKISVTISLQLHSVVHCAKTSKLTFLRN